ncbi:MAG: hypothetical protein L3K07_00355 [Thermoplasmata archaeon]|nr:hypothetical protein [Thermoplasmata archaeon]
MSAGPPPRRLSAFATVSIVLGLVTATVGLLAIELTFYPGCAGCASASTPVGTALEIGNGTGACIAGNGSTPGNCAYSFSVKAYPSGAPPTTIPRVGDLSFRLWNSAGVSLNSTYVVAVANEGGGWMAVWNSTSGSWTSLLDARACGGTDCLATPFATGDSLILRSLPSGGLPYSHQGDQLIAMAVGGGFDGSVDAPIN